MALDVIFISRIISLVLTAIGGLFGIIIAKRLTGKLKHAVIYLILVFIVLILANITGILEIILNLNTGIVRQLLNIATAVFALMAMICMKQMINHIDGNMKKR